MGVMLPSQAAQSNRTTQRCGVRAVVRLAVCAVVAILGGCAFLKDDVPVDSLRQRILPPFELGPAGPPASLGTPTPSSEELPMPRQLPASKDENDAHIAPVAAWGGESTRSEALTLEEAIDLALRSNPTLEAMQERVAQAEGGRLVAFAEFLPQAKASYRHIAGDVNPGEFVLPTLPTYVGNLAFGGTSDRFDLAELNVQWVLWDFGRTPGRFGQAVTQVEIAKLQYDRAKQTVAYNVAVAYLQVLQARARQVVAAEAVRRAESFLRDARNFYKRGAGIRNNVLRAEVLLSEMRLNLVKARTAEGIAVAALNQAIGINVSLPTAVIDRALEPSGMLSLADCLQLAVDNRDEFGVVLRAIRSARLGTGVAQADFCPKVLVGGVGAHQDTPAVANANILAGGLNIELALFEGGRRRGKLQAAEAELRMAVAQGKEVCDRIAYEIHAAYLLIDNARQHIDLSRTAVIGATENLRVVRSLFEHGDATPTDVVDGELALTRAQQELFTALYEYQTAMARLAYAVGAPVLTDFAVGPVCNRPDYSQAGCKPAPRGGPINE